MQGTKPGEKEEQQVRSTRILLVDDHPLFLRGMRLSLEGNPGFEVIGEARNGYDAVELSRKLLPDIVLCDIRLGDLSGFEVAHKIKQAQPGIEIIFLSMYDDDELLYNALKAGATAFCSKTADPGQLVELIREVAAGNTGISQNLFNRISSSKSFYIQPGHQQSQEAEFRKIFTPLTGREIEILELMGQGHSNQKIASILNISDQTVKNHITQIFRKLKVRDRTQAVLVGVKHGWIKSF